MFIVSEFIVSNIHLYRIRFDILVTGVWFSSYKLPLLQSLMWQNLVIIYTVIESLWNTVDPHYNQVFRSTTYRSHYRWTAKRDRALSGWVIIGSPCIHLILHHSWRLRTTVYFINVHSKCLIICWLKHKYYLSVWVESVSTKLRKRVTAMFIHQK